MSITILIKLLTAMACAGLAATIIVRDPGFRPNRLMGALLICLGWWSLMESLAAVAPGTEASLEWMRCSGFGWIPVSAFLFHTYAELRGNARSRLHQYTKWIYCLAFAFATLYAVTPWGLRSLTQVSPYSWHLEFGWLMAPALVTAVVPAVLVIFAWRKSGPRNGSGGERRTSTVVLASLTAAVGTAVMTDAIVPLLGFQSVTMGSTAIAMACGVIAVHLQRYGFSLLSADAFAEEIIGSLPDGVALVRRDGSIRYMNPVLAKLIAITPEAARGLSVFDLLPNIPQVLEAVPSGSELVMRCVDGRSLPVVVSPVAVTHERRGIVGFALIVRDRRDVAALRQRLVLSARLAAVGDLSSGIAREIMRPILEVRGSLADLKLHWQVLGLDIDKAGLGEAAFDILEEGKDLIDESLEGVDRVTALVRHVQGFTEPSFIKAEPTDVNQLVEHAMRIALSGAVPGVSLGLDLHSDLPWVSCRRGELEQVLVNLVVNAFHAVDGDGQVSVETAPRNGGVQIRVKDDGCGIPASVRDRIFDPFFTTKPVGEGTGLGLAICYHIIRNHGGTIDVDSTRGNGTVFTVDLPSD